MKERPSHGAPQPTLTRVGSSVPDTDRQNRCGRLRLDGGVCRTPVARAGLACRWHLFADQPGPTGPWPFDIPHPGTCPGCGAEAIYHSPGADRFFHLDGSDNRSCWNAIHRRSRYQGESERELLERTLGAAVITAVTPHG